MPPATSARGKIADVPRPATSRTLRPLPPSALSNTEPVAAAARERLAADAERRPDFARRRSSRRSARTYSTSSCAMELDGMQVRSASRASATVPSGASRKTPTGSMPDLRAVPASGAASLCRDMAGAAWHEHEAGERRWPGGADVRAAIQSAEFGAAEDEFPRGLCRFSGAHQRRADQEGVDQRRQAIDVGAAGNAGFGNQQAIRQRNGQAARSSTGRC